MNSQGQLAAKRDKNVAHVNLEDGWVWKIHRSCDQCHFKVHFISVEVALILVLSGREEPSGYLTR